MEQLFVSLFTEMNTVSAILLIMGSLLLIIEAFVPGFGVFGFSGILASLLGIIVRMFDDGLTFKTGAIYALLLVLMIIIVYLCAFAISYVFSDKKPNAKMFKHFSLIGKRGTALTELENAGKVIIDGRIYNAVSNKNIVAGKGIEVVDDGKILTVKEYNANNEDKN